MCRCQVAPGTGTHSGCSLSEDSPHPAPHLALSPWLLSRDISNHWKLDTSSTHLHHTGTPVLVAPHGPCPGLAVLPDTSREEILGALGLAERVKGMAKTISATLWDPEEEIAARRREIRGLRMELLAGPSLSEQSTAVAQLQRALRELKVGNAPGSMGLGWHSLPGLGKVQALDQL